MQIHNLDINILYFLCDPRNLRQAQASCDIVDVVTEFSDIPAAEIVAAIRSMADEGLLNIHLQGSRVTITPGGIHRLRSSIACRIHHFERCRCGSPL